MEERYYNIEGYYDDQLRILDLKIKKLYMLNERYKEKSPYENLRGIMITEEEISGYINSPVQKEMSEDIKKVAKELECLETDIDTRLVNSKNLFIPLLYLQEVFGLSDFERDCIMICLSTELDTKYQRLYAYLNDDLNKKAPTVDVVLKLLCKDERLDYKRMFYGRTHLNTCFFTEIEDGGNRLAKELKLDERIVEFLLGSEGIEKSIQDLSETYLPSEKVPTLIYDEEIQEKLRSFVVKSQNSSSVMLFHLFGPKGSGKKLQIKHLCKFLNTRLMIIDVNKLFEDHGKVKRLTDLIYREAVIGQAVVCFDNFDVLLSKQEEMKQEILDFIKKFTKHTRLMFIITDGGWKQGELFKSYVYTRIEFDFPDEEERKRIWQLIAGGYECDKDLDFDVLSTKFKFSIGTMAAAFKRAESQVKWEERESEVINDGDLSKACYSLLSHSLDKKASLIKPKYGWNDIILPDEQKAQLKMAVNHIKYRHVVYDKWGFERKLAYGKGLSMLFSGPPGTGKTMAAQVIARELLMEIYKVDLSQIVSKYIGETEKNLREIFDEANLSNAILFFDETDALFGKRSEVKDAHDKYANIETSYLLQKMEEYDGITILATNFLNNIDEAFMRRITFVVKFPFPDQSYRELIWKNVYPIETPLAEDIDFNYIAKKIELAGGNIKNIAVASSYLAASMGERVSMKHIMAAAKLELQKMGKLLLKDDLGEFDDILQY